MKQDSIDKIETGLLKRYRSRLNLLKSLGRLKSKPTFEELREKYVELTKGLNRRFPELIIKTEAENKVYQAICRVTNLKFERSVWIRNRNVDLFSSAIGHLHPPILKGQKIVRVPLIRGLAIEVDGSIHDREFKMRQDESKSIFLHELGICLSAIPNEDLNATTVRDLIEYMKSFERLDTRARRRLLRTIYTSTIAYHADDETLTGLYGQAFTEIRE